MKKGQAAMEFLMTYGWAIIVVLAAIGALAYFGVLSPSNLLPERTTFAAPIQNVDNAVISVASGVMVSLTNNLGSTIVIDDVTPTKDCTAPTAKSIQYLDGTSTVDLTTDNATVNNGQQFIVVLVCSETLSEGERFESDITIDYTNADSGLSRPHTGSIQGKVTV